MNKPLNFGLIGAAGYIAPRHIKAIADTGNNLMVAYDKFDSVGRLDSSFPDCSFFEEMSMVIELIDTLPEHFKIEHLAGILAGVPNALIKSYHHDELFLS